MAKVSILVCELSLKELTGIAKQAKKNNSYYTETAAKRYLTWLKARFIRLSQGGSEWPELESHTIKRKTQRAIASDPLRILIESRNLYQQFGMIRRGKGHLVGITGQSSGKEYRGKSPQRIAKYHQGGEGNNPTRRVVATPTGDVRRRIGKDVREAVGKIIRRNRKSGK